MFLTEQEVIEFTGYKRPSKQAGQLRKWGIRHFVARDGRPRVLRADLATRESARDEGPRLDGLAAL